MNRFQDQLVTTLNSLFSQPAITGSCGGNVALKNLIKALAEMGLVQDKTEA